MKKDDVIALIALCDEVLDKLRKYDSGVDYNQLQIASGMQSIAAPLLQGNEISSKIADEIPVVGQYEFRADLLALTRAMLFTSGQSYIQYGAQVSRIKMQLSRVLEEKSRSPDQVKTERSDFSEYRAKDLVILVHGIRDYALWQTVVEKCLSENGFKAESTNYGRFDLFRFLLPIPYFRKKAANKVLNQIRMAMQANEADSVSVIAHSFGTYVMAHILKDAFDVRFKRIIFCGSVVKYGFPFEQFSNRFERPILNEVGARDFWPAMAESVTWGYGSAGTYGFRRPFVKDRWHNRAGHGFFLNANFCRKYWVPYLENGEIIPTGEDPDSPSLWVESLSLFRLKYIALAFLLMAAFLVTPKWWQHDGKFPAPNPPAEPADSTHAQAIAENAEIKSAQERALDLADARAHLRREIEARKEKSAQYVYFLGKYSIQPNSYRVEANRLYGPTEPDRLKFLILDSKHLLTANEIERLTAKADLDEKAGRRVQAFVASYARFLAAVDDLAQQQHVVLGMYNLQKFAREATVNATDALCALDADLGDGVRGGGPEPFGCAPVYK